MQFFYIRISRYLDIFAIKIDNCRPKGQKIIRYMLNTRRDFIKITSLSAAGLVFGGHYVQSAMKTRRIPLADDGGPLRTPTYCEVCFWQCAGWVYKNEEGNIQKVIGNDDDQNCNGRLCPRGTGGVGMYYDEDRLKAPLLRVKGNDTRTISLRHSTSNANSFGAIQKTISGRALSEDHRWQPGHQLWNGSISAKKPCAAGCSTGWIRSTGDFTSSKGC